MKVFAEIFLEIHTQVTKHLTQDSQCSDRIRNCERDFRGSVHHSKIHKEKSNKMQQCIKIYYSIFILSSTSFGRHTAHHQEPKTVVAASGFAYVEGCWTCGCWTLSGTVCGVVGGVHHPQHTQISSNSSTIAADNSTV
jgi:hypothetical protein